MQVSAARIALPMPDTHVGKAAATGLYIGGGTGLLAGGSIGYIVGKMVDAEMGGGHVARVFQTGYGALFGAAALGLAGGAIGTGIGALTD